MKGGREGTLQFPGTGSGEGSPPAAGLAGKGEETGMEPQESGCRPWGDLQ